MINLSNLKVNIDNEIAEVVTIHTNGATVYKVWNNISRHYIQHDRLFVSAQAAREAARRLVELYSGSHNLVCK